MKTSDFEPKLPKMVARRFPSVERFAIDYMAYNVRPVQYDDGRARKANEYPPVVSWCIGRQQFSYVLKPTFKAERWGVLCWGGTTMRAEYSDEEEKLWQLLQWSVEGKTADEINRLLGNERADGERSAPLECHLAPSAGRGFFQRLVRLQHGGESDGTS